MRVFAMFHGLISLPFYLRRVFSFLSVKIHHPRRKTLDIPHSIVYINPDGCTLWQRKDANPHHTLNSTPL